MTLDTVIGKYNGSYYDTYLISIGGLKSELNSENPHNKPVYTAKQFCDRRYNTCLYHFNYDPYTGEKLDWKEIRNMLEST